MSVPQPFSLAQPVISQYLALFTTNMPAAIAAYNLTPPGLAFPLPAIVQYFDYLAPPSAMLGGCPAIGMGEGVGPSRFTDDLIFEAKGTHPLLINAYVQSSDHAALVHQLRGYLTVLLQVINADRVLGATAVLAQQPAQVWVTRIKGAVPGPALEVEPSSPEESPHTWLSWAGISIECDRNEIQ